MRGVDNQAEKEQGRRKQAIMVFACSESLLIQSETINHVVYHVATRGGYYMVMSCPAV